MSRLLAGALTAYEVVSKVADAPRRYAATFCYQGTPATRYWRMTLPAKFLPGKTIPAHHLIVRKAGDGRVIFPQLRGDTAIVQFPADIGASVGAYAMAQEGKKFILESDDNYTDFDGDPMWMQRASWDRTLRDGTFSVEGHRWIAEHAHGVIVTTRALAQAYGELNDNVHICRNSIDPSDWPEPAKRDNVFRIGWYASDSHDRDAPLISKALSWASRQPGVEVINIGHNPAWRFKRTQVPWTDSFLNQRAHLRTLDVGVAPIVMSPQAKYRSDLKALEYAMGGAMPVLQASEPYWEWENLLFAGWCTTPSHWVDAIKWCVENQDEVRARATQAREYVLRERTFKTEIEKWRAAVNGA